MSDFDVANVEYERERSEPTNPNFVEMPTKKLGCLSVFLWTIIGLIAFRLIGELAEIFFNK